MFLFFTALFVCWLIIGIGFFCTLSYAQKYDLITQPYDSRIPLFIDITENMKDKKISNPLLAIGALFFMSKYGIILFGIVTPLLLLFTN